MAGIRREARMIAKAQGIPWRPTKRRRRNWLGERMDRCEQGIRHFTAKMYAVPLFARYPAKHDHSRGRRGGKGHGKGQGLAQ